MRLWDYYDTYDYNSYDYAPTNVTTPDTFGVCLAYLALCCDIQHNYIMPNDTQHINTQWSYIQYRNTQHDDTEHHDTHHSDT